MLVSLSGSCVVPPRCTGAFVKRLLRFTKIIIPPSLYIPIVNSGWQFSPVVGHTNVAESGSARPRRIPKGFLLGATPGFPPHTMWRVFGMWRKPPATFRHFPPHRDIVQEFGSQRSATLRSMLSVKHRKGIWRKPPATFRHIARKFRGEPQKVWRKHSVTTVLI